MNALLIDLLGAILLLSGAGSAEDLSESEMERFEHYYRHPLPVNQVPRSRMLSSGLFSAYQVAAIEEYRLNSGDILGPTELSLVDGIGPAAAEALCYFVSFDSALPPGSRENKRVRQSLMARGSVRWKGDPAVRADAAGSKYHLQAGERAEFYWSGRNTYTNQDFAPGTFSLGLYSRRGSRLMLGDFAARFGQGLVLWSSYSMSGFGGVAAFRRNATGFAPTGSFSPALSGIALDVPIGRWSVGAALGSGALRRSLAGGKQAFASGIDATPIAFVSYLGRRGQFGLQALHKDGAVVSADGALGLGHWTLFGESAVSSKLVRENGYLIRRTRLAVVGGAGWAPAYKTRLVALARYYPADFYSPYAGAPRSASKTSDETGLSLGAQWRWAEATIDAAYHPEKGTSHYKVLLSYAPELSLSEVLLKPVFRWTSRFRPEEVTPWRHELRADLKATGGPFSANCRLHQVRSKEYGALGYIEAGFVSKSNGTGRADGGRAASSVRQLSLWLRATAFRAENWADRVYCYERDVPGAFTVPAYYGRGRAVSFYAGLKYGKHSFWLKSSLLRYHINTKAPSSEIRLQYLIEL